jgi:putative aldouronate transport system permease protein
MKHKTGDVFFQSRLNDNAFSRFKKYMNQYWVFYVLLLPAIIDIFIFHYLPIYGVQIGFRDFRPRLGITGSEWVGLKHFIRFVESPNFIQIMRNTVLLSFYNLAFGFPIPIMLAIMINEIRKTGIKKTTQMITYMPHFISMVAVVGIINLVLHRDNGIVNVLLESLGHERINFLANQSTYRTIYVTSEIWQHTGWGTIIYLAALASVDSEVVEAARIDGASRTQKIRYIDFPTILPTIIILLILRAGTVLSIGFEKVYLLQNDLNRDVSEIIATYTYRLGILNGQFSYTTAIGMFNNVLNATFLIIVNSLARRFGETSLW